MAAKGVLQCNRIMANAVRVRDGQVDFSAGVQSANVATKNFQGFISGILPNQLAWGINLKCRGGGLSPRDSLQPLVQGAPWSGLYQGGILYQPDFDDPTLLLAIGGRLYKVRVDTDNSVVDLSTTYGPGLTMPDTERQAFFTQAECFAIWQAGDLTTLPIFYDSGVTGVRPESLRRSNGFLGAANPANEIPAATAMDYWANRTWFARGREYAASDIVFNKTSGSSGWDFRDSVLKCFESPVANQNDAFILPTAAGNIRALAHTANLDSTIGESQLYVFTRRSVYACVAPITRDAWVAADLDNMPLQKLVISEGGAYSDRAVVPVNQDIFFSGPPNGDVRSVAATLRYAQQWGLVPLSRNVNRALLSNDRSLLRFSSGVEFDNRLLIGTLPVETPVGVASRALLPLDFDVISTFEERRPPAWEGVWEGLQFLQLFSGDFGGRPRAFAVCFSTVRSAIEVWELRPDLKFDNTDSRITWVLETPAYTFNSPLELKQLETLECWFDRVSGTSEVTVEYRPDSYGCWIKWHVFKICAAKDCLESVTATCIDTGYPQEPFCDVDKATITLPKPPVICIASNSRPSNIAYQFAFRIRIHGWCRLRGVIAHALPREKPPFANLTPC